MSDFPVFQHLGAFVGNSGPLDTNNDRGQAFLDAGGKWIAPMILHGTEQDASDVENERLFNGNWAKQWREAGVHLGISVWVEHDPVKEAQAHVRKANELSQVIGGEVFINVNGEIPYKLDGGDPTGEKNKWYVDEFMRISGNRVRAFNPIGFGWRKAETDEYFPQAYPFDYWRAADFSLLPQAYLDPYGAPGSPVNLTWVIRANRLVYPVEKIHPMLGAYGFRPDAGTWARELEQAREFGFTMGASVFNAENLPPPDWRIIASALLPPGELPPPPPAPISTDQARTLIIRYARTWEESVGGPKNTYRLTTIRRICETTNDQWYSSREFIRDAIADARTRYPGTPTNLSPDARKQIIEVAKWWQRDNTAPLARISISRDVAEMTDAQFKLAQPVISDKLTRAGV